MEMFLFCVAVTIIIATCLFALGFVVGNGGKNERVYKRELHNDCDIHNVPDNDSNSDTRTVGNVYEPIDCGQDLGSNNEAEKAVIRLHSIRARAARSDYAAIDYAIESIYARVRVEQILKERGI